MAVPVVNFQVWVYILQDPIDFCLKMKCFKGFLDTFWNWNWLQILTSLWNETKIIRKVLMKKSQAGSLISTCFLPKDFKNQTVKIQISYFLRACQPKYSKSLSWAENLNKMILLWAGNLNFLLRIVIWNICLSRIKLSDKKSYL